MTLKQDLIKKGYLPENLPPSFSSNLVGAYFDENSSGYLSETGRVRPAIYNASKRGMSRRAFSAIHPATTHDLAEFINSRQSELEAFFQTSNFSMSVPRHTPDGDRAIEIATHGELEEERLTRLSGFRFIAKTDISRFYHSVYTHAIPWAYHGKADAKRDTATNSNTVFFNRLDFTLRQGQDGQTIGIPVGPDAARYIAEVIATAIDREFNRRCDIRDFAVIRHVDDVWIGAHTHADAEAALWRYRESLRDFELDVNENKTRIYAENFQFSDAWPSDVATRLEQAVDAPEHRRAERLRAALEYAFSRSTSDGDDGVLKYAIRQLDKAGPHLDEWPTIQSFLMRAAIHFGHTIDYVVRVLVWRQLTHGDLDVARWTGILHSILDRQGRLGNDSEVCWSLFAALRLGITIPSDVSQHIVRNCGALSIVSLLNNVKTGRVPSSTFDLAFERVSQESAKGPMWPVFLEWLARDWPRSSELQRVAKDEIVEQLARAGVTLFDDARLTRVFTGVDTPNFGSVKSAIEKRISSYDTEGPDQEDEATDF